MLRTSTDPRAMEKATKRRIVKRKPGQSYPPPTTIIIMMINSAATNMMAAGILKCPGKIRNRVIVCVNDLKSRSLLIAEMAKRSPIAIRQNTSRYIPIKVAIQLLPMGEIPFLIFMIIGIIVYIFPSSYRCIGGLVCIIHYQIAYNTVHYQQGISTSVRAFSTWHQQAR